jgi:hypothetical protein
MARKSWTDRLNDPRPHQVKPAPINIAGMKAGEIMLIPTARIVDDFIRAIPAGQSMDIKTLRQKLARKYQAEVTWEAHHGGTRLGEITPFWRVLDATAPTTSKLACGAEFVTRQRKRERIGATRR